MRRRRSRAEIRDLREAIDARLDHAEPEWAAFDTDELLLVDAVAGWVLGENHAALDDLIAVQSASTDTDEGTP